jgi:DNA-binding NtrC family response regulator
MARILIANQNYHPSAKEELISRLLEEGYEIVCVEDYTSAMELLQKESIQAVMTTPVLGSISGYDLLHAVRTLMPTIPLIILLNFATYRDFSRLIPLHLRFIEGPFDPDPIIDTLRIMLQTTDTS